MGTIEMRKYRRIPFSSTENVDAVCRYPDDNEPVMRLHIANISEGGLGLMMSKATGVSVKKDDILYLEGVVGNRELEFVRDLELEVMWVLDSDLLSMIGFGCRFKNLPGSVRSGILQFMNGIDVCRMQA